LGSPEFVEQFCNVRIAADCTTPPSDSSMTSSCPFECALKENQMPEIEVSGNVKDKNGNPLSDVIVEVFPLLGRPAKLPQGASSIGEDTTDKNGLYDIITKVDSSVDKVLVKAYAFKAEGKSEPMTISAGALSDVEIVVPVGIRVATRRVSDTGEPSGEADQFSEGEVVFLRADIEPGPVGQGRSTEQPNYSDYRYEWEVDGGSLVEQVQHQGREVHWDTSGLRGVYSARVKITGGSSGSSLPANITVSPRALQKVDTVPVTMRRTAGEVTEDLALWVVIRKTAEAMSFENYSQFMNMLLCDRQLEAKQLRDGIGCLSYSDSYAYRLLKAATEAFLMVNCGVANFNRLLSTSIVSFKDPKFTNADLDLVMHRVGVGTISLQKLWKDYLKPLLNGGDDATIPYLALVREKLSDVRIMKTIFGGGGSDVDNCYGLLRFKLTNPCLFELIWSYWHEEAMLVQTLHAITTRFQNIQGPSDPDPLRMLEIDPLRPLNNLLWGYLQDEQYRLGVLRRAYEYDHHYGITLYGKAVPQLRPADSRSKFLEAFHTLLYLCAIFFKEDDDTTVIADGFPVLNALKEVHFLLAEGAHNQFGDMPSNARLEMMVQQWILSRPEFREFLPTRIMVAYPEPWMDRVDAMKTLQGWTDVSVLHFRNLAIFGEQILLSIRFGAWSTVNDPAQASNWARYWRAEIQGYIHAYRAATGVDLTAEVTDARQAALRVTAPGILLRERLTQQRGQPRAALGSSPTVTASLPPARVRARDR
jgi:hypothetical protein